MTSLLNVMLADRVQALIEAPEMSNYSDEERAMRKETALAAIHGILWAYCSRSESTASIYAYDGLADALKPVRQTLEGLWKLQDRLVEQKRKQVDDLAELCACERFIVDINSIFCSRCGYERSAHKQQLGKFGGK